MENLSGGYGNGDVVKGITCGADAGEVLCLVGPNGCGKTTLFRLILGFLTATGGSVRIGGVEVETLPPGELAKQVAYIPQYHMPVFSYTALEVVMMGRASHFSALQSPGRTDREAAFTALEKLNAVHLANQKYTALSGGQRQMVMIARALCQEARVLIMDEPGAGLDYANQQLLLDIVNELAGNGYCVVMSTHSPEHPAAVAGKVLLMCGGKAAAFGRAEEVIVPELLEGVYGIEMDVLTLRDRYGVQRTICLPVKKKG